jgi:hypothetical protein
MMLVLGALAKGQGAQGTIPEVSAAFLHRSMMEAQIDPAGLAKATGANGVTVPGLVAALRDALQAPEHAQYLHWGATSQDIQDSGLMLRMRQALMLIEARIGAALAALADLAEANAETPQAARTYGQVATPSSFGALAASWGSPLLRLHDRLEALRPRVLCVSLSGAAGTASMLGADPDALRAALAGRAGAGRSGRKLARQPRPDRGAGRMAGRPDHGLRQDGGGPDAPVPVGDRGDRPARRGRVLHHAAETEPGCAVPAGRPGPLRAGAGGGAAGRGGPCRGAGRRGVVRRMADAAAAHRRRRARHLGRGRAGGGAGGSDGRHGPPSR